MARIRRAGQMAVAKPAGDTLIFKVKKRQLRLGGESRHILLMSIRHNL